MQKLKKHDKITVLAQTKLYSVHDTVSKAINDGHIDPTEFQRIIQEKQRYLILKQQIRQKTKKITQSINEEQRQTILNQGRKEGQNEIIKKLVSNSPAGVT